MKIIKNYIENINMADIMEVWGCGGEICLQHALQTQAQYRRSREQFIENARKVDKAQFGSSRFDQEFLLSKLFAHRARMVHESSSDDGKVGKSGIPSHAV